MTEENKAIEIEKEDLSETREQATQEPNQGKTFTQEEVNGFVQSRVARLKGQIEKAIRAEYDNKFQELQQQNMKLTVREALADRGLPRELADVIACKDQEDMNSKLDILANTYTAQKSTQSRTENTGFRFGASKESGGAGGYDPIRKAMGINGKG